MRLKNFLIVVDDIERSKKFYQDLFGLNVVADFDGNVILTQGLVLQERNVWENFIGKNVIKGNCDTELYFEENNLDVFIDRLKSYPYEIEYVNDLMEHSWGQRVVRIYDPDGHTIEVGESLEFVARRFYQDGMEIEDVAKKIQLPLDNVKVICGIE